MEIRNEMQDFMIHVPTQIFFGRSAIDHLAESIEKWSPKKRVLLVYGGGSIKRMGLYQKIVKIFEDNGIFWTELAGVQPNPKMGLIREGVKICKENDIDCVLAAGGGSAVDTAKAVATAVKYDGDVAELVGQWWLKEVLPVLVISTASGAGTEISTSTVLNNEATNKKAGFHGPEIRPKVTFLNPEYTFTLNPHLTAAGIIDGISHTLESYFSPVDGAYMHARMGEALIDTFLKFGPIAYAEPTNYNARANIMYSCVYAIDGILTKGNYAAWVCHGIEHELSGYDDKITHGVGLAIITDRYLRWALDENTVWRFKELGVHAMGIDASLPDMEIANKVIDTFHDLFFNTFKMPKNFRELGVPREALEPMIKNLAKVASPKFQPMLFKPMSTEDVRTLVESCY